MVLLVGVYSRAALTSDNYYLALGCWYTLIVFKMRVFLFDLMDKLNREVATIFYGDFLNALECTVTVKVVLICGKSNVVLTSFRQFFSNLSFQVQTLAEFVQASKRDCCMIKFLVYYSIYFDCRMSV